MAVGMVADMKIVQSENAYDMCRKRMEDLSALKLELSSGSMQRQITASTDDHGSLASIETDTFSDIEDTHEFESEEEDEEAVARLSMVVRRLARTKLLSAPADAQEEESDEERPEALARLSAVVRKVARMQLMPAAEEVPQDAVEDSDDEDTLEKLRTAVRRLAKTPLA
eukprot:TRINITY_DN74187_c0_g1_i1.p2 TRINITY_DN74187_c0_g1~~TRINITY_DN74187_c0_g1_i1.p2  ORF type:complete len:195 (-),score=58.63 TRINITY_DN74187_c0_g1_i1:390-896(-)